jgi:hypothetical protein
MARGADAGAELERLLGALYLEAGELQKAHPDTMRDMAIVCSTCAVAKQCRRDLAHGVARLTFHQYCPNTESIAALEGRSWWRDVARA